MMVYCNPRFKPKKKRKSRGIVAVKFKPSQQILGVNSLPKLGYGLRPGASDASKIESLNSNKIYTEKRESLMYTGTLVKGIATMHKSNAVPVIDEEQMKDISRMRRG